ncbi:MAG: hypothetical protein JW927_18825 [Deltaproteobacteria bacterium]|nr:hypothetical protein [Deltaproteobacteria bacterium]
MNKYSNFYPVKKSVFAMLMCLLFLASCQNQDASNKAGDNKAPEVKPGAEIAAKAEPVTQAEPAVETAKGKYEFKSGIVVYKTQTMGMDAQQTLSFDDYGKKEVTDMVMEMMGTKLHNVTITRDGYTYTLDMANKTGTKVPVNSRNNTNIDFSNLSREMEKEMNLKKEGTETFLGRVCDRISIDYTKMQLKGSFLVYKGVALKIDTDMGAMKMKLTAEEFEENPQIPAEKFEIPADIIIAGN